MLTCKDTFVAQVAWGCLKQVVKQKIGCQPTEQDIADYLNGATAGKFAREGGDIGSLWSRTRKSSRELAKDTHIRWYWNETRKEMEICVPRPGRQPDVVHIHPIARQHLTGHLKRGVQAAY